MNRHHVPRLNGSDPTAPSRCVRCNDDALAFIMSFYNTDWICLSCEADERKLPTYGMAREAEMLAIRSGDRQYSGIGLTPEDWTFLMRWIDARKKR